MYLLVLDLKNQLKERGVKFSPTPFLMQTLLGRVVWKLPIKKLLKGCLNFKTQESPYTVELDQCRPTCSGSFELGKGRDFLLMFIASRNQVDLDEQAGIP